MRGHELRQKLTQLRDRHRIAPIARPPLPLLAPVDGPQIVEGLAASSDIDADRMSFARGSLSWPDDLSKLPLLVRHDVNRVAGRILDLDYDDRGNLHIKARVDDPEARRMGGLSVCTTVIESEVRDEGSPAGFHFVITKAVIDEISLSPLPANAAALVTSRRNVTAADNSHDAALAAAARAQKVLEALRENWSIPAKPAPRVVRDIGPASALIYNGTVATLTRPRSSFSALVARLPSGGD